MINSSQKFLNQESRYVVFDPMALLAPISSEMSTGKYLRYEDAYHQIQTEIVKGKSLSATAVDGEHLIKPDWNHVRSICHDALENQSKDILLTIWFSVSLLHTDGFRGLQDGLQLLADLCAMFWDDIHPAVHGDPERRLAPFFWLEQKLPEPLLLVNLCPYAGEITPVSPWAEHPFSMATLKCSRAIWDPSVKISSEPSADISSNSAESSPTDPAQKKFLSATQHASAGFHQSVVDAAHMTKEIILRLKQKLLEEFGIEAPSFSSAIELLEQMSDINTYVVGLNTHTAPSSRNNVDDAAQNNADNTVDNLRGNANEDHKETKETKELFETLEQIAEKLIKNAPQCPTGYLAQQAAACRRMTMQNALCLFIPNTDPWKRASLHVPDDHSITDCFFEFVFLSAHFS